VGKSKRNREKPFKQVRGFDEPRQSKQSSEKEYAGNGRESGPPKTAVFIKLANGKTINGTGVSFDNPKMPKSKLFFFTGQKMDGGAPREFCISSRVDIRSQGGDAALLKDLNEFLKNVYEQSLAEFPEWLEKWGCRSNEYNPLLNLDEIREEWKYKKSQFGIFRLAAQAGFFTDIRPANAERPEITGIEITGNQ
jgi:hypothetical protein